MGVLIGRQSLQAAGGDQRVGVTARTDGCGQVLEERHRIADQAGQRVDHVLPPDLPLRVATEGDNVAQPLDAIQTGRQGHGGAVHLDGRVDETDSALTDATQQAGLAEREVEILQAIVAVTAHIGHYPERIAERQMI